MLIMIHRMKEKDVGANAFCGKNELLVRISRYNRYIYVIHNDTNGSNF